VSLNTLAGLGAILLWSTTLPVARSLAEQIGALTGAACVNLVGGLLSLVVSRLWGKDRGRPQGYDRRYILVCGGLFVFYFASLHSALGLAANRHQALEVGLMNYLWPSLTLLFSVPILGVTGRWTLAPGMLLATVGVAMVLTSTTSFSMVGLAASVLSRPLPYLLGGLAAVAWALYSNLNRRLAGDASGSVAPLFMLATGLVLLAGQTAFPETRIWSVRTFVEIGAISIVSATGYMLWDLAMRRGDVALVATFSYFTPLLSTLFGTVYLQVAPGRQLWLGCVLIIVAALVCRLATRPRAAQG
jgi:drug/metabolite transporter (DMT)-like permease